MSQLADLIYTELVQTLHDLPSVADTKQAHAVCLAISRAFSPDRPDSFTAGQHHERDRILSLITLRLEQLGKHPRESAELLLLRSAILEAST